MAKILKVKIKRDQTPAGTHYTYPLEYDAKKIQVLCYESTGELEVVQNRGNKNEYCIGVVKDEHASQFLKSKDIIEITQKNANVLGRKWRPQREKIIDQEKVMMILAKIGQGKGLTQIEKDALNPDKAEAGINKSVLFDDLLNEHLK